MQSFNPTPSTITTTTSMLSPVRRRKSSVHHVGVVHDVLVHSELDEPMMTPSAQLARFTISDSSSVLNTPVLRRPSRLAQIPSELECELVSMGEPASELLDIAIVDSLAEIVGDAGVIPMPLTLDFEESLPSCSSVPQSPCKPSPHRQPLSVLSLNERQQRGSPTTTTKGHWSRQTDVPLPKIRRTRSDWAGFELPSPVSLFSSPSLKFEDTTSGYDSIVPWHTSAKDAIRRITPATMVRLLDGEFTAAYDRLIVIDARYPYEYLGGHLPGAHNFPSLEAVEKFLFSPEMLQDSYQRVMVVFHCEFSSERAPRMALHVRNLDRTINAESYPRLTYPELYILEGGYKAFFLQFKDRCDPPGHYIPMRTQSYREDLRFHQRMKQQQHHQSVSLGFQGNKYNRQKVRQVVAGVGLRKAATQTDMAVRTTEYYAAKMPQLAPGEMMPEDFLSSDGPEVFNSPAFIREVSNCFH